MKVNIDLTANRDFGGLRNRIFSLKDIIGNHIIGKIYPWSFDNRIFPTVESSEQIFFTGNKSERQHKIQNEKYMLGIECDCCGKDLTRKPWNVIYRLCFTCNDSLGKDNKIRKPWMKIY